MTAGAPLLQLLLPLPPSLNRYYLNAQRTVRTPGAKNYGRKYMARMIAPEGVAYQGHVLEACRKGHRGALRLTGRLSLSVLAIPPDLQSFDLDNRWKALQDSLTKAQAIGDDSQFDFIRMVRWNAAAPGWIRVRIDRFDPADAQRFATWMGEPGVPDLLTQA